MEKVADRSNLGSKYERNLPAPILDRKLLLAVELKVHPLMADGSPSTYCEMSWKWVASACLTLYIINKWISKHLVLRVKATIPNLSKRLFPPLFHPKHNNQKQNSNFGQ